MVAEDRPADDGREALNVRLARLETSHKELAQRLALGLHNAGRLQGRRMGSAAPSAASLVGWDDTAKLWKPYQTYDAIVDAGGDGDYTDIQAALDAGHSSIFVADGTYTLTADITVGNDIHIIGASRTGVRIQCGSNSVLIQGLRSTLERVSVESSSDTSTGNIQIGSSGGADAADCTLVNCRFIGGAGRGIVLQTTEGTRIVGCFFPTEPGTDGHIHTVGRGGLDPAGTFPGLVIQGCHFDGGTVLTTEGLDVQDIVITGNFMESAKGQSTALIDVVNIAGLAITGNLAHTGTLGSGPFVRIRAGCTNVVIAGNTARGASGALGTVGVLVQSDNVTVTGNNFDFYTSGVELQSSGNAVKGNYCANGTDGILINGNYDRNVLMGNICTSNSGYGINLASSLVDRTVAIGNVLTGNTTGALQDLGTTTQKIGNVTV